LLQPDKSRCCSLGGSCNSLICLLLMLKLIKFLEIYLIARVESCQSVPALVPDLCRDAKAND
jgi:hypothetical protein